MVPASGAAPLVLMVLAPGQPPRTIPLPASGRLVFGRGGDADVQIADGSLSRAHAAIHVGPTLLLEDLGSANGTRVQPGLLGQLESTLCIDRRRVHVTGISNGGMMAYQLAQTFSSRLASDAALQMAPNY